jgi:hypothetical protein
MLRRTWYGHLARINLFIVEARQRIAIRKAHISNLEPEERGTRSAHVQLRRSEVKLQLLEDQREVILEKVRRSPLPAELCEANPQSAAENLEQSAASGSPEAAKSDH